MSSADAAARVSAIATALAAVFVVVQILVYRREQRALRKVEVEGVAVEWRAENVQHGGRTGEWTTSDYTFTAHNPGRLPIRAVEVRVDAGTAVRRLDRPELPPTREVLLGIPVIRSTGTRTWTRPVSVLWDDREELRSMPAAISFKLAKDGSRQTNRWGP